MQIGITCETACYMGDTACMCFLDKNVKIFWSYVKHF